MVGAVVVHNGRILGEGYHERYGQDHAEVNALRAVQQADMERVSGGTLYVSLEPCCHYGKTPPCTDLIMRAGISRVVIAMTDPNPKVAGKGVELLRSKGIDVIVGVLEAEASYLLRMFSKYICSGLPYVIVKFAQSRDRFLGHPDRPIRLTNRYSDVHVHKMRSEADAIMVGTNTAMVDNPKLTNRHYSEKQPVRVVLDRSGRIPDDHHLYDNSVRTIVFSEMSRKSASNTEWIQCSFRSGTVAILPL